MPAPRLRHAARALLIDEDERVLLCRMALPHEAGVLVWSAPGGGVEPGESLLDALRRELREETGFTLDLTASQPTHVWRQEVVPCHAPGYEGIRNDYFLIRTTTFVPRGEFTDAELAAENIFLWRWWPLPDICSYQGPDVFSPRDLATTLTELLASGTPARPIALGL